MIEDLSLKQLKELESAIENGPLSDLFKQFEEDSKASKDEFWLADLSTKEGVMRAQEQKGYIKGLSVVLYARQAITQRIEELEEERLQKGNNPV